MPAHRIARRRRRAEPPVRLVGGARPDRRSHEDWYTLQGYAHGFDAAQLLQRMFPDWSAAHAADRPLTPQTLYGCALAFLSLVHRERFALADSWDWPIVGGDIAVGAFETGEQDAESCLATLVEGAWFFLQPQPELYGVGVELAQGLGDIDAEDLYFSALTVALWQIAQGTAWGIGAGLDHFVARTASDAARAIAALRLLPATTAMPQLIAALDQKRALQIDGVGRGTLIAYAFSQTGCWPADVSNDEIHYCYEGQTDFDWSHTADWPADMARARQIAEAYRQWALRVDRDPELELGALADLLHTTRRRLRAIPRKPKTLIAALGLSEPDDAPPPPRDPTLADGYPFNLHEAEVEA